LGSLSGSNPVSVWAICPERQNDFSLSGWILADQTVQTGFERIKLIKLDLSNYPNWIST